MGIILGVFILGYLKHKWVLFGVFYNIWGFIWGIL